MTPTPEGERAEKSPRWAYVVCLVLVVVAFAQFGFTLDRYPLPYFDEPFFNLPAVHYLEGRGFAYDVGGTSPNGDRFWAFHGTFYPWLQVAVFKVFGISQIASRMPQYLAMHVALGALCVFLLRRGLWWTAVALAVAFLGDRAAQEVQYGRPEGLCLLGLVVSYIALNGWARRRDLRWPALCGLGAAMAAGFNPGSSLFLPPIFAFGVVLTPKGHRLRSVLGFAAGGAVAGLIQLWTWRVDPLGCLQQLRWNLGHVGKGFGNLGYTFFDRVRFLYTILSGSRFWPMGLAVVTCFVAFALVRKTIAERGLREAMRGREGVWLSATVFAMVGAGVFVKSPMLPYYLAIVSLWPLVAIFAWFESAGATGLVRRAGVAALAALVAAWLPALLWNTMRCREAIAQYPNLDHANVAWQLSQALPKGARVTGSPLLYMLMREADVDFTPLPFYADHMNLDDGVWLLFDQQDLGFGLGTSRISLASLETRALVLRGEAFPNARYLTSPFELYGPATHPASAPGKLAH